MQRLSVVIPNYNYGRYVGEAVRSALAVDWPDVEVVVVDDGSTDRSLEILRAFGNRITLVSQENAGPRIACNRGFERTKGDAVIFLDSDDVLEPTIAHEAAAVWGSEVSKVQVQMRRIDGQGRFSGRAFPTYRRTPTPEQIRHWITSTSAYPTPPGSGNVYSRWFLEKLFPLDGRCGDATDSACLAAAPYLGDVISISRPLVRYRVHGDNRSSLGSDPCRFGRQIYRALQRQQFALELAGHGGDESVLRSLRRGRHLLQLRAAERRLCHGDPPLPEERRRRIGLDAITSLTAPGPEPVADRIAVSLWCLAILAVPEAVARRMIRSRFS